MVSSQAMALSRAIFGAAILATASLTAGTALAQSENKPADNKLADAKLFADNGKLLATGGVAQVEGAGGGGLTPWALIAGYGTRDSVGVAVHDTYIKTQDYDLHTPGFAIGLFDRVELSYAYQAFNTGDNGRQLGLGKDFTLDQDIFGAKVKLFGDAVYEQDSWLPQVAVGLQHKRNKDERVVKAVGAKDASGTDYYVSATKLLLEQSLLLNGTARLTKANQFGLLGFGGNRNDDYRVEFEASAALLLARDLAVGLEYRTKPDNLRIAKEEDAYDLFLAYFLNKNLSVTAALVNLGSVAGVSTATTTRDQVGGYLSLQLTF